MGDAAIDTRPGEEMAQHRILARIRERPLFGKRRILWITRADQSPDIDPEELQKRNGNTVTTVVLEAPEKVLLSWSKKIPAFSTAVPSRPGERDPWFTYLAQKHGMTVHKTAMEPLRTSFEGSMGPVDRLFYDISREAKEKANRKKTEIVTEEVLEGFGITSHYKTVFDLMKGLGLGDRKFFREWKRFLENGQSPFGLISLLHRQWRLYRIAASVLSETGSPSNAEAAVASIGGVPPYFTGPIVQTARKLDLAALTKGADALREADMLLKSGIEAEIVMDSLASTLFLLTTAGDRATQGTIPEGSRPGGPRKTPG